jgi:hypothetical protein
MPREKKRKETSGAVGLGAGLAGAAAAAREAAAADAMIKGMDLLRRAADSQVKPEILQGNLFEYIEAAKFNVDAALKGSDLHAAVTAAEGQPTAAADLVIRRGSKVVQEVQAKSYRVEDQGDLARLTRALSRKEYDNMQKVTTLEQAEQVRDLAAKRGAMDGSLDQAHYQDTARNVTGQTHYGQVSSGGTSYRESRFAAEHPRLYAAGKEIGQKAIEAGKAGLVAAGTGALVGGAISLVQNSIAVSQGAMSAEEALRNTVTDAVRAGLRGGATGATGAVVRYGAQKAGLQALSKSNVATAVAAGLIEAGVTVYRYAKGEITGEEAVEQMGQTGATTISSIYAGAVAGLAFGPVGAVVGSVAGYLLASNVYQSCVAILQNARLAEAEAARVERLCAEAVVAMQAQRAEFERLLQERLQERAVAFRGCFRALDDSLAAADPAGSSKALADLCALVGVEFQFSTFAEFDAFMTDGDEPLKL